MAEVAIAFPNDEPSAHVMVSRLRVDGITARIDRGLHGSWQVGTPSQITVMVDARDARPAARILGSVAAPERRTGAVWWAVLALCIAGLVLGIAALVQLIAR